MLVIHLSAIFPIYYPVGMLRWCHHLYWMPSELPFVVFLSLFCVMLFILLFRLARPIFHLPIECVRRWWIRNFFCRHAMAAIKLRSIYYGPYIAFKSYKCPCPCRRRRPRFSSPPPYCLNCLCSFIEARNLDYYCSCCKVFFWLSLKNCGYSEPERERSPLPRIKFSPPHPPSSPHPNRNVSFELIIIIILFLFGHVGRLFVFDFRLDIRIYGVCVCERVYFDAIRRSHAFYWLANRLRALENLNDVEKMNEIIRKSTNKKRLLATKIKQTFCPLKEERRLFFSLEIDVCPQISLNLCFSTYYIFFKHTHTTNTINMIHI